MSLRDDQLVSATSQATTDKAARTHDELTMEEGKRIRERKQAQSNDQAKKMGISQQNRTSIHKE